MASLTDPYHSNENSNGSSIDTNQAAPSDQLSTEQLTTEQLFKLLQQHLNLWSKPEGLSKIYPQAAALSQRLVLSYRQRPSKWIAQLHLHKPHYDYITNITAKAMIFTCICVNELKYTIDNQYSIVGASLCANIAALNVFTRQANGHPLSDKHKAILVRSHILSYKLLIRNRVLDSLWLQTLAGAIPQTQSKRYSRGYEGTIVALSSMAGKLLSNPKKANKITVAQVMRQLYLETKLPFAANICQLALSKLHRYSDGSLVKLKNQQLAQIIRLAPEAIVKELEQQQPVSKAQQQEKLFTREDGYVVLVFNDYPKSFAGRLLIIAKEHISSFEPCLACDNPKIYAQTWEGPLNRFMAEKGLTEPQQPTPPNPFTPPKELVDIVAQLFNQVSLNRIAAQVRASTNLNQVVIDTATAAAKAQVTIKDAKHAIALLGLNRIGPILYRGAMVERLSHIHFAGRNLVDNRFDCLLACVEHFNQFNDLVQLEPLLMYVQFYLAPWYLNTHLQQNALKLYQRHSVETTELFKVTGLINLADSRNDSQHKQNNEQHQQDIKKLLDQWQLPKFAQELMRNLQTPMNELRVAKPVASAIAVIKLSIYNCNAIFNELSLNQQLHGDITERKQIDQYLRILRINEEQFEKAKQDFYRHHQVYTPLI